MAASSAGAGNADSLEAAFPEGGEHAGAPAKSPQPSKSPGADCKSNRPSSTVLSPFTACVDYDAIASFAEEAMTKYWAFEYSHVMLQPPEG